MVWGLFRLVSQWRSFQRCLFGDQLHGAEFSTKTADFLAHLLQFRMVELQSILRSFQHHYSLILHYSLMSGVASGNSFNVG